MPTRIETTISIQLEILPKNKILIPGCEPTSALSSNKLSSWLAQSGCGNGALINLSDALNAIPGSYVKYGANFNRGGSRQAWFVLPGKDPDCPCQSQQDWFKILRNLPKEEQEVTESFDSCGVIGMGYCPSPDFDEAIKPLEKHYEPEGTFPAGAGVLPPIPPWGHSGT